jgi:hypothetical protein
MGNADHTPDRPRVRGRSSTKGIRNKICLDMPRRREGIAFPIARK